MSFNNTLGVKGYNYGKRRLIVDRRVLEGVCGEKREKGIYEKHTI